MSKPPSTKQLGYLKGLGYRLTPPESSREASLLIDWLKEGRPPKEAETQLKKHRRAEERKEAAYLRRAIADERRELRELRKDNRDFDLKIIGFVFGSFSPDEHEESEAIYEGTFLPLEVAEQHPELMLVSLPRDTVTSNETLPDKVVVAPGVIQERPPAKRDPGCAIALLLIGLTIVLVIIMRA